MLIEYTTHNNINMSDKTFQQHQNIQLNNYTKFNNYNKYNNKYNKSTQQRYVCKKVVKINNVITYPLYNNDIITKVYQYLLLYDIGRCSLVCKLWYNISNSDTVYSNKTMKCWIRPLLTVYSKTMKYRISPLLQDCIIVNFRNLTSDMLQSYLQLYKPLFSKIHNIQFNTADTKSFIPHRIRVIDSILQLCTRIKTIYLSECKELFFKPDTFSNAITITLFNNNITATLTSASVILTGFDNNTNDTSNSLKSLQTIQLTSFVDSSTANKLYGCSKYLFLIELHEYLRKHYINNPIKHIVIRNIKRLSMLVLFKLVTYYDKISIISDHNDAILYFVLCDKNGSNNVSQNLNDQLNDKLYTLVKQCCHTFNYNKQTNITTNEQLKPYDCVMTIEFDDLVNLEDYCNQHSISNKSINSS